MTSRFAHRNAAALKPTAPRPLHVQDWEAKAMFAGTMTRKRVPQRIRWTPRGSFEPVVTNNPIVKARAGHLFWIGEPHTWSRSKGNDPREYIDYGHSPIDAVAKPYSRKGWEREDLRADQMWRTRSRMTIELATVDLHPLVDISDTDIEAEGMRQLELHNIRLRYLQLYRETYGVEFAELFGLCLVLTFKVHPHNIATVLAGRGA